MQVYFGRASAHFRIRPPSKFLDSVTLEDWGAEIFAEGVGVKWRKWARGEGEGKKKYSHTRLLDRFLLSTNLANTHVSMFLSEINFRLPVKTKLIFIGCLHIPERRSSATN